MVISAQRARSLDRRAAALGGPGQLGDLGQLGEVDEGGGHHDRGLAGSEGLQPLRGVGLRGDGQGVELAEDEDLAGRAVRASGGGQPQRTLAVVDGVVHRQLAEGGAEPGGVDAVAVPGDGQGEAEEQGGVALVAVGGRGQRFEGVVAGEDRDERLDGRRQPEAGDVLEGRGHRGRGAVGREVGEQSLCVAVEFSRGWRTCAQFRCQGRELPQCRPHFMTA
ncbi:hypothetical protein [Nonomuraea dietziae]|uniref:Uncharacterized protein n=1 Tax=Nonomuraea dietziae TaxID=65515 RepID=A0A7W5YT92_9ACTN|nr:hypothetical protein [Nonomuraea dietziae]MBB3730179.1 hypothetical protein [Nonomuraea dietziae]